MDAHCVGYIDRHLYAQIDIRLAGKIGGLVFLEHVGLKMFDYVLDT